MNFRPGVSSILALCLLATLLLFSSVGTHSQPLSGGVIVIDRGNPLRGALLDAARSTFVAETGGDVEFVVRRLTVWGPWAFGQVKPQRPGGSPIDWSRTSYADIHAQGDLDGDGESYFLLIRHSGQWVVHEFAIGPTDVVWAGWADEYALPAGMFSD